MYRAAPLCQSFLDWKSFLGALYKKVILMKIQLKRKHVPGTPKGAPHDNHCQNKGYPGRICCIILISDLSTTGQRSFVFEKVHLISILTGVVGELRWHKWITFHFHTTSQFRIPNSEFRIPKFALRIWEFGIRNCEVYIICAMVTVNLL